MTAKVLGEEKMGSYCLMGIEFQFCKMKKFRRLVVQHVKILNIAELYT